ncbi:hypothetical protein RJ639_028017 [Escallonia herrerae]|uniref:DNA-directed DNA polymerase n=1 Tax=Escallonia herrerae TaxID=1293975 RepID=A0AA89BNX8_9ASTE|nr:hypothetical protein RJ639_028017 [Escallonia herrerae]
MFDEIVRTLGDVRLDNGIEYKDEEFLQFYKDMGIIRHFSVRTLKQNEVVERMNKILLELAKCMRLNGDLPKSFWVKAVNISCYLINHSPTFAINHRVSKESSTTLSTTEAEYMALIEAAKEALWLKGLVEELGFKHRGVLLQCDSQSVMDLAKNQRDAATAPNVGDRVPYVIVKAAKGAKAYERSEDPIYVLENNIPIDPQYYLENQISKPLLRIFEPILKNASKELLQGGHTRSISISTPSNSGIMRFAKKQLSCIGCKALISRDCPIFYRRKKAQKDMAEAKLQLDRRQLRARGGRSAKVPSRDSSHLEINEQHNVDIQTDANVAAITDTPNIEDEALNAEMTSHLEGSQIDLPSTGRLIRGQDEHSNQTTDVDSFNKRNFKDSQTRGIKNRLLALKLPTYDKVVERAEILETDYEEFSKEQKKQRHKRSRAEASDKNKSGGQIKRKATLQESMQSIQRVAKGSLDADFDEDFVCYESMIKNILPPPSTPRATGHNPAETTEAEPLDEPPEILLNITVSHVELRYPYFFSLRISFAGLSEAASNIFKLV